MNEEDYHDTIWSEFEVFLYTDWHSPTKLHLPLDRDDGLPYCHDYFGDLNYTFREKSVGVYPPGWREICKNCLKNWRQEIND